MVEGRGPELRRFSARLSTLDLRLEFFHVFVGQFDGADERLALAEAVAIGAAGHEQMKFVGNFQIALGGVAVECLV